MGWFFSSVCVSLVFVLVGVVLGGLAGGLACLALVPASVALWRLVGVSPAGPFSVGCASGADLCSLAALLAAGVSPSSVLVSAVGAASGAGFWAGSALAGVRSAAAAGARVAWLAGGPLSLPLRVRLARRSLACLASAGPAPLAVGFFASPSSVGSLRSAAAAFAAGASVFAFCVGPWSPAPVAGAAWVACPSGPFASAWRLVPLSAQLSLFS